MIKFLRDYGGTATGNRHYAAGQEVPADTFDAKWVDYMVNEAKVAELAEEKPKKAPAKRPKAKKSE